MNLILIIYGVMSTNDYLAIRDDLAKQFEAKGLDKPIFVNFPADYYGLEVVWLEKPESERVTVVNNVTSKPDSAIDDFAKMRGLV
jgi:hypothetical protein